MPFEHNMLLYNVFKSGTLKSGTPECTPKIESGAGAALILEIESEEGAPLNILVSEVKSGTLKFSILRPGFPPLFDLIVVATSKIVRILG